MKLLFDDRHCCLEPLLANVAPVKTWTPDCVFSEMCDMIVAVTSCDVEKVWH